MKAEDLLKGADLYYPEARKWMWDYCIYLGPYTDRFNTNFDLGIYINPSTKEVSLAVVYGNEPGDYISGTCAPHEVSALYNEVYERALSLKLIGETK